MTEPVNVMIPKPDIRTVEIPVIGDSRLVVHKWSKKAIQMMLDSQTGKANKKKEPKSPEKDFKDSLYVSTEGWYGVPCTAFKGSVVAACRYVDGFPMTQARGIIFVLPDGVDDDGNDLVRIEGDGPHPREDMVRIAMGKADIRYRGEFRTWRATPQVEFNTNVITMEQLVNLFNLAGHHVGVGEGRPGSPKTSMDWGRFHIASEADVVALDERKTA